VFFFAVVWRPFAELLRDFFEAVTSISDFWTFETLAPRFQSCGYPIIHLCVVTLVADETPEHNWAC